jgi:hypothetical protein
LVMSMALDGSPRGLSRSVALERPRHVRRLPSRPLAILGSIAIAAISCVARPTPEPSTPGRHLASDAPATPRPTAFADPAPALVVVPDPLPAKLDETSRELLEVIEPGELVEATIRTLDPERVVADARQRGGRGDVLAPDAASVVAERDAIVDVLRDPAVLSATLTEDLRADRPIVRVRPHIEIPVAGNPYGPLSVRPGLEDVPALRKALLRELGMVMMTIDGQRYRDLDIVGECQPDLCLVTATGRIRHAGDVFDTWVVESDAARDWRPLLNPSATQLGGVPRPLARWAERIARTDAPTAGRIARYSTIASIRWEAMQPGKIQITYSAECTQAGIGAPDGTELAEDGVCIDSLVVEVDLWSGQVVQAVEIPDS